MTEIDTGYLKRIAEATETESASVGDASAANQTSQITQETATAAALGTTAGAAVITDANGTIQQYLRGLVKRWVDALGAGTSAAALRVTLASDSPGVVQSDFGSVFPSAGIAIGINNGTNLVPPTTASVTDDAAAGGNMLATGIFHYNGVTWDRARGDTTAGLFVQVKATLPAIGITPADRTIVAASGASQTLMAANINRKSLTIVNTGNANCGVNPTGGTAVIGGAGTLTLVPMGAYSPRVPTLSAVTAIGTAGQPIYADES